MPNNTNPSTTMHYKHEFNSQQYVYEKKHLLFMKDTFLKNPLNSKTVMLEIKMLYEKWDQGNQLEMKNNNVQIND